MAPYLPLLPRAFYISIIYIYVDKIGYVLKRQCTVVRRMLPFTDFGICGAMGIS